MARAAAHAIRLAGRRPRKVRGRRRARRQLPPPHDRQPRSLGVHRRAGERRHLAGDTSITRPRTKGPRSLMVTITERPLLLFVTFTLVPNGSVRWAAVNASRSSL